MEEERNNELEKREQGPLLFSKRTIQVFSVVFSVFFGSILLAINLRQFKLKTGIVLLPVGIGFACNYLLMMLIGITNSTGIPIIVINGLLGILLTDIFWKRYIGEETEYQKRPVTVPLLIGIGISLVMLIMMMVGGGM